MLPKRNYTDKFKQAWKKVQKAAEQQGEEAARLTFRDEMLKLGHNERVDNLYRVRDKLTGKARPFARNAPQKQFAKNRTGSDMILKCRQVGFTTDSCIRALDYVLWTENMVTGIMAHKQNAVLTIFKDIVKFSYEHFVKDFGWLYNPTRMTDSSTSLSFKDDGLGRSLNSVMYVMFDFRSKTPRLLHISEAHFIEDDRLLGSLNGVPETGEIILETTPNGMGGEFYRLWSEYRKRPKASPYKGFFIPWYEYYPELPEKYPAEWPDDMTDHEKYLQKEHGDKITPQHLWWRRITIQKRCQGDLAKFEREYPSNDQDCFLTNEAGVFPRNVIVAQQKNVAEPQLAGFLLSDGPKVTFTEDDRDGIIDIWTKPKVGETYVMGVDPAGGVGKDKSAVYVKSQKSKKLVARIWGDLAPADLAREVFKLATYYNKAWVCIEANNHGGVVIHALKGLGYTHLYKRQVIDEITNKPTRKIGFVTNNESKLRITEQLKVSLKNNDLIVLDEGLIVEMTTFMQFASKTGRTIRREAASNAHDDLVIAAALVEEMDRARPERAQVGSMDANPYYGESNFDPDTGFLIA